MSYNIDTWKTKELRDFRIPMTALHPVEDYLDPPALDPKTNILTFTGRADGFELRGRVGYDAQSVECVTVESIKNYSEASGTMQEYLVDAVFPHSTGYLHAVLIWEGGDSITRLVVKDGEVSEEKVEL